MYVGTDVGVYNCTMGSNVWSYSGDLPKCTISDIKLNKLTGDLVVATYGRAIWKTNLGSGYCFNSTAINIDSNTTWNLNSEKCQNVNVNSGYTLKVTANVILSYKSTVTVKSNATLEIDGGSLKNGNFIIENGGNLIIKNNGKIILCSSNLNILQGGIMTCDVGEVQSK